MKHLKDSLASKICLGISARFFFLKEWLGRETPERIFWKISKGIPGKISKNNAAGNSRKNPERTFGEILVEIRLRVPAINPLFPHAQKKTNIVFLVQ